MTAKEMTPEAATALRRPFPPESLGKLPKGGVMLDFAGHAAVTDRLLAVDREWSWDFAECDPATGQPSLRHSIDPDKNLWIRLTICGVTRIGVGDGPNAKERIGDALRNAAMRFGVGLDLWAKENLVEFAQAASAPPSTPRYANDDEVAAFVEARNGTVPAVPQGSDTKPMTAMTRRLMFALFNDLDIPDAQQLPGINQILGTAYESRKELTEANGKTVIADLAKRKQAAS